MSDGFIFILHLAKGCGFPSLPRTVAAAYTAKTSSACCCPGLAFGASGSRSSWTESTRRCFGFYHRVDATASYSNSVIAAAGFATRSHFAKGSASSLATSMVPRSASSSCYA